MFVRWKVRAVMGPDGAVAILLATFNGAPYLRSLLDSIEAQSSTEWFMWTRDDGSTDATIEQLQRFEERHQDRMRRVRDHERLGARGSFDRLLSSAFDASRAQYFFFCDQDDVWHVDKVERLVAGIRDAESRVGASTPILLHSDLRVVGPGLEIMHPSLKEHQRVDASVWRGFRQLLVQNVVTGCAAVVNRALVRRMGGIPEEAVMHDWWSALVAAAFGQVVYYPYATVDYRQHATNVIGAQEVGLLKLLHKGWKGMAITEMLTRRARQAEAFQHEFGGTLAPAEAEALAEFLAAMRSPALLRGARLTTRGFAMSSLSRTLGLFAPVALSEGHNES